MIRIIIADDHAIVREGLKQIVSEVGDITVTGEAGDADQLMVLLAKDTCDLVILDISMPGKSGMEALKDLKSLFPSLPVLILSMYSEDQYGIRALKAGAAGFLKKVSAPDELVTAIRKIVSGGRYINEALAEKLADSLEFGNKTIPHESLSDREFQIMCQIASGMSADAIADSLSISVHTVYSYRNRLLEKMNMKSNVELTQYVIKNNLIDI